MIRGGLHSCGVLGRDLESVRMWGARRGIYQPNAAPTNGLLSLRIAGPLYPF
jgi:hypothetical protein